MKASSLGNPTGGSDGTMKTITLTKVTDMRGHLPVDSTFDWTYTTAGPDAALQRARKAFENAVRLDPKYREESILDWKVVS